MAKTTEQVVVHRERYVKSTDHSCEWLKAAVAEWGSCVPEIEYDEEGFYLSGCDDYLRPRFEYCPGCGRKFEIVGESHA
jgi:hypothetical protein